MLVTNGHNIYLFNSGCKDHTTTNTEKEDRLPDRETEHQN